MVMEGYLFNRFLDRITDSRDNHIWFDKTIAVKTRWGKYAALPPSCFYRSKGTSRRGTSERVSLFVDMV